MFPESKIEILKKRAFLLKKARLFFEEHNYLEVDCPSLCQFPPIDDHIDVFEVCLSSESFRYLHTSPEYGMKKLLSMGIGNIFQLSHVFRKEENGRLHNSEFSMAEWYKLGISFEEFIDETLLFLELFLGKKEICKFSYRDLFLEKTGLDSITSSKEDLFNFISSSNISISNSLLDLDKDALLQWMMGMIIEPMLIGDKLYVVDAFPATQAALAEIKKTSYGMVGMRFEIYYAGIELANGYQELTDPQEQKKRFEIANQKRKKAGKDAYPVDINLLKALEKGIPPCCGVAVGFDRLVMLHLKKSSIQEVIPFSFELA